MSNKKSVYHEYDIPTHGLSPYGKVKALLSALEDVVNESEYGYKDGIHSITIWWRSWEEI